MNSLQLKLAIEAKRAELEADKAEMKYQEEMKVSDLLTNSLSAHNPFSVPTITTSPLCSQILSVLTQPSLLSACTPHSL
jgi:hypothetical protein